MTREEQYAVMMAAVARNEQNYGLEDDDDELSDLDLHD